MICDELRGKLASYVDYEFTAGGMAEDETHLRGCASCATEVVGLLQTKRVVRAAATRYVPSPEFRLRMEQGIHAKRTPSLFSMRFPRLVIAAVGAGVLITLASLLVERTERESELTEIADLHRQPWQHQPGERGLDGRRIR